MKIPFKILTGKGQISFKENTVSKDFSISDCSPKLFKPTTLKLSSLINVANNSPIKILIIKSKNIKIY